MHFFSVLLMFLLSVVRCTRNSVQGSFTDPNPLNGRHLRVLGLLFPTIFTMERNATGHILSAKGTAKDMIDTLSQMLNFSYVLVPHSADRLLFFDDSPIEKGAISYLADDKADYVIGPVLGNPFRFQKVDFPSCWDTATFGGIVPYPRSNVNIRAALKPLSYEVWITVIISILITGLFFHLLSYEPFRNFKSKNKPNLKEQNSSYYFSYVLGNILSQGQRCFSNRLVVRVAAGAWCLGCFFLIQIYCCTLTSHLTSPNQKPIVNSFHEIADTPGVHLTVDKLYAIDNILVLQNLKHTGFMKRLSDMLRDNPDLRCNTTSDCLNNVKKGHAVYLNLLPNLQVVMANELKRNNNTCDFTFMKETFWPSSHMYTVLPKHSPYTETISRGIWRLRETGLIKVWQSWHVPSSRKCLISQRNRGEQSKSRLSIGNLSSAFLFWLIGTAVSFFMFIIEKFLFSGNKI